MEKWFARGLKSWYSANKRDLPWRDTNDPYRIWLSEVILQQTQVVQGTDYYHKFVSRFPTVKQLAAASEDEVLKLWQGLGYYSRARNLHAAAKYITGELDGQFPVNYTEILKMKGVGAYTAAAIASFAHNEARAVVDGNVYRVLSRIFGISTAIDSNGGKKEFQALAEQLLDRKSPGLYNQSVMEFGALHCRPVNPGCNNCIFRSRCLAFAQSRVHELPVKAKKVKIKTRHFNYFVVADNQQNLIVNRRSGKDIWKGLYEFPLVETSRSEDPGHLFTMPEFKSLVKRDFTLLHHSQQYRHVLTHQHLIARFYVLKVKKAEVSGMQTIKFCNINRLAFPRLIDKFLQDCDLKEIL